MRHSHCSPTDKFCTNNHHKSRVQSTIYMNF